MTPMMRNFSNVWMPALMNDILGETNNSLRRVRSTSPAINVTESDKAYTLELAVPGITKEMASVQLHDDTLSVKIESKQQDEQTNEDNTRYLRREFSYESYEQSFTLPEDIEAESITANVSDGILSICMPKKAPQAAPTPRQITIQ